MSISSEAPVIKPTSGDIVPLKIHYSLTNPGTIYDEEALTALELAGRTAHKVNECVDKVNDATNYMHTHLDEFVDKEVREMVEDGTLDTTIVNVVAKNKVDKGGLEQVTWPMLAQDVKEMMNGTEPFPGVGVDAVNTTNIVNRAVTVAKTANAVMTPHLTLQRYYGKADAVVFNLDTVNKTANIVNGGKYNFYVGCRYVPVDFDSVTFDLSSLEVGFTRCYVYYYPTGNLVIMQGSQADVPSDYVFLGLLVVDNPHASTLCIPFSVDDTYLYNPRGMNREQATVLYYPLHHYSKTLPYVDYKNKRIVFPSVNFLYLVVGDTFYNLSATYAPDNYVDGDFVIPFGTSYQFIVGGADGIRAIDGTEFKDMKEGSNKSKYFYLGCLHAGSHHANLNFDFIDGAGSLSILGDSISTAGGEIPEGNNPYYDNISKEQTWWNMVMRRCGLYKNTVQAWSGRCVTNISTTIPSGVDASEDLDNGTPPDNIIVYMGTNDFRRGVPLGSYDCRGPIPTDASTFREAYAMMLHKILGKYPRAKVYACTLQASERNSAETSLPEKNTAGVYLFEYNEAIREIAQRMNVEVIELETCGLNYRNGAEFMWDYSDSYEGSFTHPNSTGHKLIANKVIQSVLNGRNYNM